MAETVGSANEWDMPYMNAKRSLQDKYKATQEEIVLWIETKEITPKDAWCIINVGGKEKEVLRWNLSGMEPGDLIKTLESLYFNEDEIKNFVPEVRWVSFKQIVGRWEKYGVNSFEAAAKLHHRIGVMPSDKEIEDDDNLHMYQYPLSDIEEIEKSFPPLVMAQAEAVGDDGTPVKTKTKTKTKTNTKRTTKLNDWLREKWDEWGKPNAKDFADKLKPFQDRLGSPVKKYHGWLPRPNIILEWQPGWGSTSNRWTLRTFSNKVDDFKRDDKNTVVK